MMVNAVIAKFLLYSPLNQGLKQDAHKTGKKIRYQFLLYSPFNQGLKQGLSHTILTLTAGFYSTVH